MWKVDKQGFYLSPGKTRSSNAVEGKSRKKKQGDKYFSRKLTRLCPKCNAEIKKKKRLRRCDALGVNRDVTVFICENCHAVWLSKQTNKVWQDLKRNGPKISHAEFKKNLEIASIPVCAK